jgi:hypothetical protein
MTRGRAALLFVASFALVSCTRGAGTQGSAPESSSVAPANAAPAVPVPPSAAASPERTAEPADPAPSVVHEELARARFTSFAIVGWQRPGVFHATLARPSAPAESPAIVMLALVENPLAYRRTLAFEKLARGLGMRVVPAAVLRRIGTGELGTLFAHEKDLRNYFARHAAVQNDGTVDALVIAPSRGLGPEAWAPLGGRDVTIADSVEASSWARWVASPEAVAGEDAALARDYVETLVLDYLSGNVLRRVVHLDEAGAAVALTDNGTAFPSKVDPRALDLVLARLRPVVRFPRGLRDALVRLDRNRTRRLLTPGPFASWLVPPRTLVDLDERRKSLLSLIEARIAERGEASVLCL